MFSKYKLSKLLELGEKDDSRNEMRETFMSNLFSISIFYIKQFVKDMTGRLSVLDRKKIKNKVRSNIDHFFLFSHLFSDFCRVGQ